MLVCFGASIIQFLLILSELHFTPVASTPFEIALPEIERGHRLLVMCGGILFPVPPGAAVYRLGVKEAKPRLLNKNGSPERLPKNWN